MVLIVRLVHRAARPSSTHLPPAARVAAGPGLEDGTNDAQRRWDHRLTALSHYLGDHTTSRYVVLVYHAAIALGDVQRRPSHTMGMRYRAAAIGGFCRTAGAALSARRRSAFR
jgi:hypothetical protein